MEGLVSRLESSRSLELLEGTTQCNNVNGVIFDNNCSRIDGDD